VEEATGYNSRKVGRLGHSIAEASRLEEGLRDELMLSLGQAVLAWDASKSMDARDVV
jgi:hypothetical protein